MFGNPEYWMRAVLEISNSDKKDIAQQHHVDLKKGGRALNPETPPWSFVLIWAPPPPGRL
jgi:hypothetical protein